MSNININQSIVKIFNEYQIKLTPNIDYIIISIQNNNSYYESKFNLEYLHQFKLLIPNLTINEMIDFIIILIDRKEIKLEKNEDNLKLILISSFVYPNVELILNKKNMIEKLSDEIEELKKENKLLKNNYEIIQKNLKLIEEENKKLNNKLNENKNDKSRKDGNNKQFKNKIEIFEKKNDELKKKIVIIEKEKEELKKKIEKIEKAKEELKKKIELIEKTKEELKNKIELIEKTKEELKKKIELIEKTNEKSNNKIEKENEIINESKNNKIFKKHYKIIKCNLQNIESIQPHNNSITSVSSFPSGNIISVSIDYSIIIYDIHLNILQTIKYYNYIYYVEVKDENNFITCSYDNSIKLWIKKENQFIINKTINNAHKYGIIKVIYYSNENLISCSVDDTIKIWIENDNNNYENIKILSHSDHIYSILFLEDKNILISSGNDGTKFWNLNKNEVDYNNINCIKYFKEVKCSSNQGLCRLDEDRIIIGGEYSLKVISISNKIIIKGINCPIICKGIILIENKGIFLIGGKSKHIRIYRNDNYQCIKIFRNAHDESINGFVELKNGTILSYSDDKKIKIWKY